MRVLHVNDYVLCGGCEIVLQTTVSLLRARGIEVEVFTSQDVPGAHRTPLSYVDSRGSKRALARTIGRYRPDVVHLHNFYHALSPGILGVLSAYRRAHRVRVVMTAHDYHLVCPSAGMFYLRGGILRFADVRRLESPVYLVSRRWDDRGVAFSVLKLVQHLWNFRLLGRRRVIDCVLCPSRFLQRVLSRFALPTVHVPYPAPKVERTTSRPRETLRLVFAGRVEREKGIVEFLESYPTGFPGRLTVVGDGRLLGRCREICRGRDLEVLVEFRGRLPRNEVLSIIGQSHVLVLPSMWVENHPISLLEALALGTNILVSDLGGMREIVDGSGVGFTFEPNNPGSLAEALDCVMRCFREGTLNQFDASGFLGDRDEGRYVEQVIRAYSCEGQGPTGMGTAYEQGASARRNEHLSSCLAERVGKCHLSLTPNHSWW